MPNTLVYTSMTGIKGNQYRVAALLEDDVVCELDFHPMDEMSLLGNIYIGRVKNVVKNLNAAFIEIQKGCIAYLSFSDMKNAIFTKKISKKLIAQDEELLVQVKRDAIKTKAPVVTADISLHGRFCVVDLRAGRFSYSKKLSDLQKKHLSLPHEAWMERFGIIIRTEAEKATADVIYKEIKSLSEELSLIIEKSLHREAYACLHQAKNEFPESFLEFPFSMIDRVVTDDKSLYEVLKEYLGSAQNETMLTLDTDIYPLYKKFSLESALSNALKRNVWLKSGANLIIDYTEAMTVIDVNSAKNLQKDQFDVHVKKINLEAAKEIARQLRLRNLSGMIIVDFINMNRDEDQEELIQRLKEYLNKDRMQASFIDITKLGLVEITRKKYRKSLREQVEHDKNNCVLY